MPAGRHRAQFVVDEDGMAPDLDPVAADRQNPCGGGESGAEELDEGAEAEAFRLVGRDVPGLERKGGDGTDAGDHDVVAQRPEHLREQSARLGAAQERGGGGGRW